MAMDHSILRSHVKQLLERTKDTSPEPKKCSRCKFFPEAPAPVSDYRKNHNPQPLCEFCRADPDLPDVQKPDPA
jgi:hypothetical protein